MQIKDNFSIRQRQDSANLLTKRSARNFKTRHQPKIRFRSKVNAGLRRGFVKISANWSFDAIGWMWSAPETSASRKWWYLTPICLVRERYLFTVAREIAPRLSSWRVQVGVECEKGKFGKRLYNSSKKCRHGVISLAASLSATYSASVVLRQISDCKDEDQWIGTPW